MLDYRQRTAKTPGGGAKAVVHAILPNGQQYPHPGTVDFIDIQAAQGADTLTVRAIFPNPDSWLVVGQIVNLTVEAGEPTLTLTIPQAALQVDQSGSYVLVVAWGDKVEQRRVKLGPVQGPDITVSDGLKPGELVIAEGIQKVRPGEAVTATADLAAAMRALVFEANQQPELASVFSTFAANSPQVYLDIDRNKAQILGVPVSDIFQALQATMGGFFINQFNVLAGSGRSTCRPTPRIQAASTTSIASMSRAPRAR